MILNKNRFTNLTPDPKMSRMYKIKKCLITCCAKVPEEVDKSEIDTDLLPVVVTPSQQMSSKNPPPYSDAMRLEYLRCQNAEILQSATSDTETDYSPRLFFGFEQGPITPHQLEKAYWWRKYYIAKSEKLSAEEKLKRLHQADILYHELKEDMVRLAGPISPVPES